MSENKQLSRREFLNIAGISASSVVLASIGGAALAQGTSEGGEPIVLGVGSIADAGLATTATPCQVPCQFMYRSLVEYNYKDGSHEIVPALAHSWEVLDDGLRYRFHLRDDVILHDGSALTAAVMANWINMQTDENHPNFSCGHQREKHRLGAHDRVEVVDDLTIDFYITRVNPAQMDWFTQNAYAPFSLPALEADACDIILQPVSTGPYKYKEWDRGVRVVLEKHDGYYDPEVGQTPNLIVRAIPEPEAQIAALEAGEVHWIEGISAEDAERLRSMSGIQVRDRKTLYVYFLHLDNRIEPLNDVRVRQALNYATDNDSIVYGILGGAAEPSYSPLSPQFGPFYAGDQAPRYDYNPDKARELLAEAGLSGGFETTIHTTTTPRAGQERSVEICEFIQSNWADVGITANIEASDWQSFESQRVTGAFPIASRGWTPWTGDPDGTILQNFHPEWHPPNGRGVCFLDDDEATNLMNHARGLTDLDERAAAWIEVQKRIVALAPWVFIHHGVIFEAHTDRLKGYNPWPGGIAAGMDYAYLE